MQILKVLPTDRGARAETAWVTFCRQRAIDAWCENFGRKGTKLKMKLGNERITIRKAEIAANDSEQNTDDIFEEKSTVVANYSVI